MIVGILSETHGHVARTTTAMRLLLDRGSQLILHCGDIGSEAVLVEMAALLDRTGVRAVAVLGNVDRYASELEMFPTSSGVEVHAHLAEVDLDGKPAAVIHGDDFRRLDMATTSGQYRFVFTGHTHVADDRLHQTTRVINPGAVRRAPEPSVALLDVESGTLEFIRLATP